MCSGGGVGELTKTLGKLGVGMRAIALFSWGFSISSQLGSNREQAALKSESFSSHHGSEQH